MQITTTLFLIIAIAALLREFFRLKKLLKQKRQEIREYQLEIQNLARSMEIETINRVFRSQQENDYPGPLPIVEGFRMEYIAEKIVPHLNEFPLIKQQGFYFLRGYASKTHRGVTLLFNWHNKNQIDPIAIFLTKRTYGK